MQATHHRIVNRKRVERHARQLPQVSSGSERRWYISLSTRTITAPDLVEVRPGALALGSQLDRGVAQCRRDRGGARAVCSHGPTQQPANTPTYVPVCLQVIDSTPDDVCVGGEGAAHIRMRTALQPQMPRWSGCVACSGWTSDAAERSHSRSLRAPHRTAWRQSQEEEEEEEEEEDTQHTPRTARRK
jgi:hypothetical protein